jgi:hypothetical protein
LVAKRDSARRGRSFRRRDQCPLGVFTILLGLIILRLCAIALVAISSAYLRPEDRGTVLLYCVIQLFMAHLLGAWRVWVYDFAIGAVRQGV